MIFSPAQHSSQQCHTFPARETSLKVSIVQITQSPKIEIFNLSKKSQLCNIQLVNSLNIPSKILPATPPYSQFSIGRCIEGYCVTCKDWMRVEVPQLTCVTRGLGLISSPLDERQGRAMREATQTWSSCTATHLC